MKDIPTFENYVIGGSGLIPETQYDPSDYREIIAEEFQLCEEFIKKYLAQTSKIGTKQNGSYHLKHVVEMWYNSYVSNGAFILAAINQGFRVKPCPLNAVFNIKKVPTTDSCIKFLENEDVDGVHKKSLWNKYAEYCRDRLNFFPPVKKGEFLDFISTHVQFDKNDCVRREAE